MRESTITTKIITTLNGKQAQFYFKVVAHPFQIAGLPDIIGISQGRFEAIEVKVFRGKNWLHLKSLLSDLQHATLTKIANLGGNARLGLYIEGELGFYLIPYKHLKNYELIADFKADNRDYFTLFP